MGCHKWFVNYEQGRPNKTNLGLQRSSIVLFLFSKTIFKWSRNLNLVTRNINRCFWISVSTAGFPLKNRSGWFAFIVLQKNITSWTCFVESGVKHIFCSRNIAAIYMFSDIFLEYDTIFNKRYATAKGELYPGTTPIPYTRVIWTYYQTLSKKWHHLGDWCQ